MARTWSMNSVRLVVWRMPAAKRNGLIAIPQTLPYG